MFYIRDGGTIPACTFTSVVKGVRRRGRINLLATKMQQATRKGNEAYCAGRQKEKKEG